MLLPDVKVLIYAFRPESEGHDQYRQWLDNLVNGPSNFALTELMLSGFIRVVTNRRAFPDPAPVDAALKFTELLISQPNCRVVRPGPRHYSIFAELCRAVDAKGNAVPDAYHAAIAIESGCEFITNDRGFGRFKGLRWSQPVKV